MVIGDKLNALLVANNMKPGTLARETNISKSTIYGILKRNNKKVDLSILETIANHLGIAIDYFFEGDGDEVAALSEHEFQLISQFRLLDQRAKLLVESVMKQEAHYGLRASEQHDKKTVMLVYVFPAAAGISMFADDDFDGTESLRARCRVGQTSASASAVIPWSPSLPMIPWCSSIRLASCVLVRSASSCWTTKQPASASIWMSVASSSSRTTKNTTTS